MILFGFVWRQKFPVSVIIIIRNSEDEEDTAGVVAQADGEPDLAVRRIAGLRTIFLTTDNFCQSASNRCEMRALRVCTVLQLEPLS